MRASSLKGKTQVEAECKNCQKSKKIRKNNYYLQQVVVSNIWKIEIVSLIFS